MNKLNIVDMFCGGGGESTGLIEAAHEFNFDINCGKKNKCVQWHKVIKYAGPGEINFNCVQLDKWEDED